jgi:recombination DNA repair RAD52 pathway protein
MNKEIEIKQYTQADLSLANDNSLNAKQLQLLLKKTPSQYVRQRPAKGGGVWHYVSGAYVRKVLNLMFGWDWDFEVLSEMIQGNQVIVKGKLTCRVNGKSIIKTQFGCKEIMMRKGTNEPLNLGNDFKSATTDALKKCSAEIGIAGDIYGKDEFKEIDVIQDDLSSEAIHNSKEKERVIKHIENATTMQSLEQVQSLAIKYELEIMYDKKQENILYGFKNII